MQRYPNFIPRARSNSASRIKRNKSVECFTPVTVTNAMKRSVIQWVNSLGLERFVVFNKDCKKDHIFNGILLCEVIGEVFAHKVRYTIKPINEEQCVENFNIALKVLQKYIGRNDKFPKEINEPSEEIA